MKNIATITHSDLLLVAGLIKDEKLISKRFVTLYEYKILSLYKTLNKHDLLRLASPLLEISKISLRLKRTLISAIEVDTVRFTLYIRGITHRNGAAKIHSPIVKC